MRELYVNCRYVYVCVTIYVEHTHNPPKKTCLEIHSFCSSFVLGNKMCGISMLKKLLSDPNSEALWLFVADSSATRGYSTNKPINDH